MSKAKPVVLFFLENGGVPSEDELKFIKKGRANGVVIAPRNRVHVAEDHKQEEHDAVHALDPKHIPAIYEKSPRIDEAIKGFLEEQEERRKLIGDEPAPPPVKTEKNETPPKKPNTGGWKANQ
jgi:hypothetical protein